MRHVKIFESFVNEGVWSGIMKGVRSGSKSGPWSLVSIYNNKVVGQDVVKIMDAIPAAYEEMKRKYPQAHLHIEDETGQVVWSEKK
jgi:hypothetical protein